MTDSRVHPHAQVLADKLAYACGGDRARASEHLRVARVLSYARDPFDHADDVLNLLQSPAASLDTFPAEDLDQFIRDALAVLDPGPVNILPVMRGEILKTILKLIRGELKPRAGKTP